jgi:D-alanyl-D-alanine carboxypeptidase/D-alanyl-D-alanine-endopeptidase (penicillin-binding protein 4)
MTPEIQAFRPFSPPTRTLRTLTLGLAFFGLGGCATFSGQGAPTLDQEIRAIISTPPLDQVHWGILIVDPDRGQTLFSLDAHKKFVPASNMKVLSTATALSLLGPDFRFETEVWGVGQLDPSSGRLKGDLVVRPVGDPTLSERFYPSAVAPLDSLALDLWEAGVRTVEGSLVVDASAWDSTTVPGSWMVGNLTSRSAATGSALAIGEGEILVEVTAASSVGGIAETLWWPETPDGFFSTAFTTVPPDSSLRRRVDYRPESHHLRMEGQIPLGEVDTVSVAQRDPARIGSEALLKALEARGIQVEGPLRVVHSPREGLGFQGCGTGWSSAQEGTDPNRLPGCPDGVHLATLSSPPMIEMVEAILEPSQNWMTEQLVRALGMALGEGGSWREGFQVEEDFFSEEVGVDTLDIHYRDGSGLSAYNLVTPRAMVRIFEFMRNSPNGDSYRMALAEPGEEEGTLRSRLSGLENRVYGKTGTISHVNSLSGYLVTENGRELIFSILSNGSGLPSGLVRGAIDQVVQAVARR